MTIRLTSFKKTIQLTLKASSISLLLAAATALPARAAEKIFVDYGFLGRSISFSSLERFAQDGSIDDELAPYLRDISSEKQQILHRVLSTPLSDLGGDLPAQIANPFTISQWLYSPIGDILLSATGLLIQTRGGQNGQQALRAAMVLAAADPEGLSLINVIRLYPTEGIRVDLPQVLAGLDSITTNIETTERLVSETIQQSEAVAQSEPPLDYAALGVLADTPQFEVEVRELVLNDEGRDSASADSSGRTFPADLYLPKNLSAISGPIPVMVFSHGYGDTRTHPENVAAARSLAANGFVVAVPEHTGSNKVFQDDLVKGLTQESFEVMEFINRPQDIQFLLDTLEEKNDREFQGRLQLDRVGLVGHSFGGYTALALAGATIDRALLQQQCDPDADFTPDTVNISLLIQCRVLELAESPQAIQQLTDGSLADERVGFVFALSPLSNLFGPQGVSQIEVPVAIVGGSYDIATPIVQEQLKAFQGLTTSQKYFYLVENLSHTSELTRAILELVHPRSDLSDNFKATEEVLFNVMLTVLIAHGKTHLLEDEAYRPYLTSAYVKAASVEPTKVHLIQSFSRKLSTLSSQK